REEREAEVEEIAEQRAEERILDLLLPPVPEAPGNLGGAPGSGRPPGSGPAPIRSFIVGPGGAVEERITSGDDASVDEEERQRIRERRERTREKLRTLLRDGKLEDRLVEVEVQQSPPLENMMLNLGGMENMDFNVAEMLQEMLPKRKKRRTVSVAEARRILLQDGLDKLVDMDEVVNEALERTEETGIIFLDEIDKIAGERAGVGP